MARVQLHKSNGVDVKGVVATENLPEGYEVVYPITAILLTYIHKMHDVAGAGNAKFHKQLRHKKERKGVASVIRYMNSRSSPAGASVWNTYPITLHQRFMFYDMKYLVNEDYNKLKEELSKNIQDPFFSECHRQFKIEKFLKEVNEEDLRKIKLLGGLPPGQLTGYPLSPLSLIGSKKDEVTVLNDPRFIAHYMNEPGVEQTRNMKQSLGANYSYPYQSLYICNEMESFIPLEIFKSVRLLRGIDWEYWSPDPKISDKRRNAFNSFIVLKSRSESPATWLNGQMIESCPNLEESNLSCIMTRFRSTGRVEGGTPLTWCYGDTYEGRNYRVSTECEQEKSEIEID